MSEVQALETPLFLVAHGDEDGADAKVLEQVALALHRADRQFKLFRADSRSDLPRMVRRAALMAHRYRGMLVAAGGDGTMEAVAQEALRIGCPFGALPQSLRPQQPRRAATQPA